MLRVLQRVSRRPTESIRVAKISASFVQETGCVFSNHFSCRNSSSSSSNNMAKALVIVADGTEEMEAVGSENNIMQQSEHLSRKCELNFLSI